jgi:hypothetical protein
LKNNAVLPFRSNLRPTIDGSWGNKLHDGTFDGMVGMLNRKEVDVAVSVSNTVFTVTG